MALSFEQHARRRLGIGASEIGAVVGLSRFGSAIEVWRRKCEPSSPQAASVHIERGEFLEPALREWYAYRYEREVTLSDTLAHPEHDIVLATPDGISAPQVGVGESLLLEIKSPGRSTQYDWGEDGTDEIPLYYIPQVIWGMAVCRLQSAHVVALVHGELRCYLVPYDAELFAELLSKGLEFWRKYVVPKLPPPVDGSSAYADYLAQKFRRVQMDTEVQGDAQADYWGRRLQVAMDKARAAEVLCNRAKNRLKAIMGSYASMKTEAGSFSWRHRKDSTTVDWKAVAEALGASEDLIARHSTTRPGPRVFTQHFYPQPTLPAPAAPAGEEES